MDEPDILGECKAQNNKLVTFLSREDSAKSLLQWVIAGLDELDQAAAIADSEVLSHAITSPDLYPSYKSPTALVVPGSGPGSPPLDPAKSRENGVDVFVNEKPKDEEEYDEDLSIPGGGQGLRRRSEADDDLHRSKYPATATEILTCNEIWSISDTIMRNADTLLTPFWDAVLPPIEAITPTTEGTSSLASSVAMSRQEAGERERARNEFWSEQDEERDRRREVIRGLWMRVNGVLLAKRGSDMIHFIQSLPNIVERIIARISSPAIQALLVTIISSEEAGVLGVIDWLASEDLIPRLLNLLSPQYSSSIHTIVAELIKQIITLCAPSPFNPHGGNAEQQASQGPAGGRDNRLIRDLVSERSVGIMTSYMLDKIELSDRDWNGINGEGGDPSPADPLIVHPLPSIASATSSLASICVILIEVIRRNNSDFSEPHLFHTLRNRLISVRMQEEMDNREIQHRADETEQEKDEKERRHMEDALVDMTSKMGIVHLGHLLDAISDRFAQLHRLVLQPRSQRRVASIANPKPFTLERFRIIELYAELLHSSNMSILNRTPGTGPVYTEDGILSGGLEGLEALGEAIEDNDNEQAGEPSHQEEDGVTPAKELPVSESASGSLTGSDDMESEDEDVLEAVNDDATPSPSPGASGLMENPIGADSTITPPLSQEVADRLKGVMETESKPTASSVTSDLTSVSPIAAAASITSPSVSSDTPEAEPKPALGLKPSDDSIETLHFTTAHPPSYTRLPPGERLKRQYLSCKVMPAMVDLFFEYPENDFMHSVVYDIFQQVLNGKLSPGSNRDLVVQLMKEAKLVERVLDAQRLNDRLVAQSKSPRLPYMGHLILIAEEIVKFFARCPSDLYDIIKNTFISSEWEAFVNTSLREAKDRDDKPLAGGKPAHPSSIKSPDDSASDEDDDDEPGEGSIRFGEPLTRTSAKDGFASRGEFDAYADHDENGDGDDEEAMDRYWKSSGLGLSRQRAADSSDDDDDADWLQPPANSWGASGGDEDDFGAWETGETRPASDEFEDDAWGNFTSAPSNDNAENPFGDDNFAPSVVRVEPLQQKGDEPLTPLDWAEQFDRAFREGGGDDVPAPVSDDGEGEQGEAEEGEGVVPIVMPSLEDDEEEEVSAVMSGSMDLSMSPGTNSWTFEGDDAGVDLPLAESSYTSHASGPAPPLNVSASPGDESSSSASIDTSFTSSSDSTMRTTSAAAATPIVIPNRHNSMSHSRHNSLSGSWGHRPHPGHPITATSPSASSASSRASSSSPTSPSKVQRWGEAFSPPDPALIAAATEESPLGPGVSPDTRITKDGMLEREVNGQSITVPQDEIVEAIERNADDIEELENQEALSRSIGSV